MSLYERAGHPTAWPLINIADVQRMRGELAAAAATCAQFMRSLMKTAADLPASTPPIGRGSDPPEERGRPAKSAYHQNRS